MITVEDLNTHLRDSSVSIISGGDEGVAEGAIEAAITEVKGYLGSWDIDTIFAAVGTARDPLLVLRLKDIAVWHFINICNVNTDLNLRMQRYDESIKWLEKVQKGNIYTEWPKKTDPDTGEEASEATPISYNSNDKKNQHF